MVEETSDVMMVVEAGFFGVVGNLQTGSHAPSEPVSIRPCMYETIDSDILMDISLYLTSYRTRKNIGIK